MKIKFLEIETSVKSKLNQMFSALNQRRCPKEPVLEFEDECIEEEQDVSTQFLQPQKNQLFDLQDHLERYCNVLPVFGFNNAKYHIKLVKSYLLPLFVNKRGFEPIVIKKANQCVTVKFGDVQLLDILNFLGGARSLDSFLKAYKTSETKVYFPYEWLDDPESSAMLNFLHTKSSIANATVFPLKNYSDFQRLIEGGLTSEEALSKLKLKEPPATGQEKYQYLTSVWQQENMCTFKDFLRWYTTNTLFRR